MPSSLLSSSSLWLQASPRRARDGLWHLGQLIDKLYLLNPLIQASTIHQLKGSQCALSLNLDPDDTIPSMRAQRLGGPVLDQEYKALLVQMSRATEACFFLAKAEEQKWSSTDDHETDDDETYLESSSQEQRKQLRKRAEQSSQEQVHTSIPCSSYLFHGLPPGCHLG